LEDEADGANGGSDDDDADDDDVDDDFEVAIGSGAALGATTVGRA
jgi:hypothetical protein